MKIYRVFVNTFLLFKELDVDGIYYADEGLYYEAKQLGIESKLIYQPETLVASSADVDFYMSLGIQSVSLAHELSLEEVVSIGTHNPDIESFSAWLLSQFFTQEDLWSLTI